MEPKRLQQDIRIKDLPTEDRRNLVGFFELLIKVDKRLNPDIYSAQAAAIKAGEMLPNGQNSIVKHCRV